MGNIWATGEYDDLSPLLIAIRLWRIDLIENTTISSGEDLRLEPRLAWWIRSSIQHLGAVDTIADTEGREPFLRAICRGTVDRIKKEAIKARTNYKQLDVGTDCSISEKSADSL
ncbi:MAG: hypothetical protein ACRBM6_08565 [Geminicoccales bacterium]